MLLKLRGTRRFSNLIARFLIYSVNGLNALHGVSSLVMVNEK